MADVPGSPTHPWLSSPAALGVFIDAWERATLPKAQWSHAAHVAVAACYHVRHGEAAFARIREGIIRYNIAVGTPNSDTRGYHETLTRFWATVIAQAVAGIDDEWRAACEAVERFGHARDLHTRHYGFDVVGSVAARRGWVAPDLAPLEPGSGASPPIA